MKKQPLIYRLNVIGGAIIIFLTIRTYMPVIGAKLGLNKNFNIWLILFMITLALSCIVPICFIEKMCDFHPIIQKKKSSLLNDLILVLSGMIMFTMLSIVNSLVHNLFSKFGITFPPNTIEPINSVITFILYFTFSSIIPAIFEELFMRGTVLPLLVPYGKRFAVISCALIFTMMHTQIQGFIPIFGAGIILSCLYLHTDNIFVPMTLHFVNNAYSFMMMYMQNKVNGISYVSFASLIMSIIIALGGYSLFYMKNHNINIFSSLNKKEKNAKITSFFKSPIMLLATMGCFLAIFSQLYTDLNL